MWTKVGIAIAVLVVLGLGIYWYKSGGKTAEALNPVAE
jgi:hypothetical protein